jgi:hypothetical protein
MSLKFLKFERGQNVAKQNLKLQKQKPEIKKLNKTIIQK